jgi:sulfate adenylyltransferase
LPALIFEACYRCLLCSAAAVQAVQQQHRTAEGLQAPHGDQLVNLMVPASERQAVIDSCTKTIECSDRNACDVELLCVG